MKALFAMIMGTILIAIPYYHKWEKPGNISILVFILLYLMLYSLQ